MDLWSTARMRVNAYFIKYHFKLQVIANQVPFYTATPLVCGATHVFMCLTGIIQGKNEQNLNNTAEALLNVSSIFETLFL